MTFKRSASVVLEGLSHYLSLAPFQHRDTPAGVGKRENDEKTVDDGTVKLSSHRLEDGMVPSVRFLSSGFVCSL